MQVLPYSYFVSYFEAAKFPNYVKKLSKAIVSVIPHFRENGIEMNCTWLHMDMYPLLTYDPW